MAVGDAADFITYTSVNPNNSEVTYTVPTDAKKVRLFASTVATILRFSAGQTSTCYLPWYSAAGVGFDAPPMEFDGETVRGRTLYFFKSSSSIVNIVVEHLKQQ